ncbi:MAG: sigma-70 family RNA polymerase sigma factor [Proteobacteria bacterium]|nr:sigma-70 family RNA polymerase sigma factor [Pseudomonadota bacterium]
MNEQKLIQQAKEGDTSCFSQLVKLYQARLYQYLLARCHSSYDAEDVLQETFLNAYKYIHSYRPKWQFSTWLFTIANRLIKKQHTLYYINSFVEESESTRNVMTSIDRNNFWIQVKVIVNPQAYDVLWFFYIEELSLKEIAKILQRSKSWVKISLFRSKKQLAKSQKIKNLSKDFLMQGILL